MKKGSFSVVIPTYNRWQTLRDTLLKYRHQTLRKDLFEIIVVDDGSTDKTAETVCELQSDSPYKLTLLQQENQGPGQARNKAIAQANGQYCFITGDDILPDDDLLWQHLNMHEAHPEDFISVLGFIDWDPSIPCTAVMHYITDVESHQFGFPLLEGKKFADYNFFYTSNISLKTNFLRNKRLFMKDFIHAAYEDIELSYRLSKEYGMKIRYNKRAAAVHRHNITLESFCERQRKCGEMAVVFDSLHPELKVIDRASLNQTDMNQVNALIENIKAQYADLKDKSFEKMDYAKLSPNLLKGLYEMYGLLFKLHYLKGSVQYATS